MRVCRGCGANIDRRHFNAEFCSRSCREKHWPGRAALLDKYREEHRARMVRFKRGKRCRGCGVDISRKATQARYCSISCRNKHSEGRRRSNDKWNAIYKVRRRTTKPAKSCAWCGDELSKEMRADITYCSFTCRAAAHYQRGRDAGKDWAFGARSESKREADKSYNRRHRENSAFRSWWHWVRKHHPELDGAILTDLNLVRLFHRKIRLGLPPLDI